MLYLGKGSRLRRDADERRRAEALNRLEERHSAGLVVCVGHLHQGVARDALLQQGSAVFLLTLCSARTSLPPPRPFTTRPCKQRGE